MGNLRPRAPKPRARWLGRPSIDCQQTELLLSHSGEVAAEPINTWSAINQALIKGARGLPGGSILPKLLAEHRGVRNKKGLPPLTLEQILRWCDAFYERFGRWPTSEDGELESVPGETWRRLDNALRYAS